MFGLLSLPMYLIAGFVNGSFATPIKHVKKWRFENIWFQHAFWAFLVLPWAVALFLSPQILKVYEVTPDSLIILTVLGGFLFGIGQVGSAVAIDTIGIGLTFMICVGISMSLGFFLPLVIVHPNKILTPFGYITMLGTLLAVIGLFFSNHAGQLRHKRHHHLNMSKKISTPLYVVGVLFAVMGGLFSAGQNLCFSLTAHMQTIAISLGTSRFGAAVIMWPFFLTCSFIVYSVYMGVLFYKNKSFLNYGKESIRKNYFLTSLMGVSWYGSLMLYSKAAQMGGSIGPIIGWPIFMVLVILTSNFWSLFHQEWKDAGVSAYISLFLGLFLLITSVVVLAISSVLV